MDVLTAWLWVQSKLFFLAVVTTVHFLLFYAGYFYVEIRCPGYYGRRKDGDRRSSSADFFLHLSSCSSLLSVRLFTHKKLSSIHESDTDIFTTLSHNPHPLPPKLKGRSKKIVRKWTESSIHKSGPLFVISYVQIKIIVSYLLLFLGCSW